MIYRVGLKTYVDGPYQHWRRITVDGKIGWRNMGSGRMIDVPNNIAEPQVVLQTYPLPANEIPDPAQLFEEKQINYGGISKAVTYSIGGLSWDVQNGSFAEGALVQLYHSRDQAYPQTFLPVNLGDWVYALINFGTYKALTEFTE